MHKFHSETLFLPVKFREVVLLFLSPKRQNIWWGSRQLSFSPLSRQRRHVSKKKWCNWVQLSSCWVWNSPVFFHVAHLLFKGHFVWPRGKVKISPKKWISQLVFGALRITLKKFVDAIGVYNNLKIATALFAALKYAPPRPKDFRLWKNCWNSKGTKRDLLRNTSFFQEHFRSSIQDRKKKVGEQTSWNIMAIYLLIFHLFWGLFRVHFWSFFGAMSFSIKPEDL